MSSEEIVPKRRKRDYKRDSKEESSQSELIVDNQQHDKQVYEHLLPTSKRNQNRPA